MLRHNNSDQKQDKMVSFESYDLISLRFGRQTGVGPTHLLREQNIRSADSGGNS